MELEDTDPERGSRSANNNQGIIPEDQPHAEVIENPYLYHKKILKLIIAQSARTK
jgi:hypothetical protein